MNLYNVSKLAISFQPIHSSFELKVCSAIEPKRKSEREREGWSEKSMSNSAGRTHVETMLLKQFVNHIFQWHFKLCFTIFLSLAFPDLFFLELLKTYKRPIFQLDSI